MREPARSAACFAESTDHSSGHCGRTFHRDLLPQNRSNSEFEAIPAAGHAQAGVSFHPGGQISITS